MLGPVFALEHLRAARRKRLYALRVGYGLLLLGNLGFCYLSVIQRAQFSLRTIPRLFSQVFFYSFASLQIILVPSIAAMMCACLITEERERRTLDYLFASDLSSTEIVLGKFAGKVLLAFGYVILAVPIIMLSIWFGGVSANAVVQTGVVTMGGVVLFGSIGTAVSATSRRSRDAVLRTFFILLLLYVLLPLFAVIGFRWLSRTIPAADVFLPPLEFLMGFVNRTNPLGYILGGTFLSVWPANGWPEILGFLASSALVSVALLGACSVFLRSAQSHLTERESKPADAPVVPVKWRPGLHQYPVLWKDVFVQKGWTHLGRFSRTVAVCLLVVIAAPAVIMVVAAYTSSTMASEDVRHLVAVMHATCAVVVCMTASMRSGGSVVAEKEQQTWDSLIATPVPSWEIVAGKCLGGIYAARWIAFPMAAYAVAAASVDLTAVPRFVMAAVAMAVVFVCFSMIGVTISLRAQTAIRASGNTLIVTLLLQGLFLLFIAPMFSGREVWYLWELTPIRYVAEAGMPYSFGYESFPGSFWVNTAIYGGSAVVMFMLCTRRLQKERGRDYKLARIAGEAGRLRVQPLACPASD